MSIGEIKMEDIQAFPGMEYDVSAGQRYHYGMTLRDYFAGQALADVLNHFSWDDNEIQKAVKMSYKLADYMLKEREK